MGRRSLGYQPAVERRRVAAPSAVAFRAAADARYRRTDRLRTALPLVLRTPPRWIRFENLVQIDARTLRRVTVRPPAGVLAAERLEPRSDVVTTRLAGRSRREETARPSTTPMATPVDRRDPAAPGPAPIAIPAARPVSMVLARPAAASAAPPSKPAPAAWPAAPAALMAGGGPEPAGTGGLSNVDVTRLTERVVAAIDRRMIAARERLGG